MPDITVCSLFHNSASNDQLDRYIQQWMRTDLPDKCRLSFSLVEGDSDDDTFDLLKMFIMPGRKTIIKQDMGAPAPPTATISRQRMSQVSQLANLALAYREEAEYVLWIESDLIWPPELLLKLFEVDAGIVAPMVFIEGTTQFYDTWAFRQGTEQVNPTAGTYGPGCFTWQPPWHPCVQNEPFEVDSAGSCLLIKKQVLDDGVHFTEDEAIVGLCKLATQAGHKIVVNPEAKLWHPQTYR